MKVDEKFLEEMQKMMERSRANPENLKPDQILLDRVIDLIEDRVDVELLFEQAEVGSFESSIGEIVLYPIETTFVVRDETSFQGIDAMWDEHFKEAAEYLSQQIIDGEFNLCCPSVIKNPSLTAETGTIQLFRWGQKVSVYMTHQYDTDHTTVTLMVLVGNHESK